jgi:hypothetical protein
MSVRRTGIVLARPGKVMGRAQRTDMVTGVEMTLRSRKHNGHAIRRGLLVGFALVFAFGLTAAPASAQSAACGQYSECGGDVGPTGGAGDDDSGSEALVNLGGDGSGPTGNLGDGDGSLPFTGYPMTPLILFVLALLATGLAMRGFVTIRERIRARGSAPHSFG